MKRFLKLGTIVGLLTLGLASQAQAVTSLQLIACQGTLCAATPVTVGTNIDIPAPVVVGDYTIDASGASIETALVSNAAETSIDVRRTGSVSATALDVYLVATNYVLPVGVTTINSTHGATFTDIGATSTANSVSFQGWISTTNSGLTGGVPAGGGAFAGPVGLPGGVQSNGLLTCTPTGDPSACSINGAASAVVGAAVPFSLITRTTFNIAQNVLGDSYTSNSQVVVRQPAVVPEPASMLLLGTGLLGVAARARRRTRKA